jgi:DNA-directed RNA polymerase beta subunit
MTLYDNDVWEVVNSYFDKNGLVAQQVDSFNTFISKSIRQIVKEAKCIEYRHDLGPRTNTIRNYIVEFGEVRIFPTPMHSENNSSEKITPNMARLRNLNYESELTLDR